jgi:hypothetical protein
LQRAFSTLPARKVAKELSGHAALIGSSYFIFRLAAQRRKIPAGCFRLDIGRIVEATYGYPRQLMRHSFYLRRFSSRSRPNVIPMSAAKVMQ